ncbi:MAG: aspartate-semialdehyde dehydrogenase [Candidatus Cloacimonas sp. 4484_209]|nr:MAG: aspartate-semialdehyde dehydrogenase [Candidatus Cloacimonas sp. 4484_209]
MGHRIAIVGATGLVGEKILQVLEEHKVTVDNLFLFATGKGKKEEFFGNEKIEVYPIDNSKIPTVDFAFFSAGVEIPRQYAPLFAEKGGIVIDNSPAFREEDNTPLVIPEINPDAIKDNDRIIANPNCSTIITLMAVYPIYKKWGVKRMVASTYQAVSGAGRDSLLDLDKKINPPKTFPFQIDKNLIPHIGKPLDNGFTTEERKMAIETRKILSDNNIKVSATCVRVPVRFSHSISLTLELERNFNLDEIRETLKSFAGIIVFDDPDSGKYPHPLLAENRDEVFVGRIRKDPIFKNGISMWVVGDNIRKGAATNAVQIAELFM